MIYIYIYTEERVAARVHGNASCACVTMFCQDLNAVLWLQLHLCKRKGTLVVVSHDQEFLNVVCNNIIHVNNRKLHVYVCLHI